MRLHLLPLALLLSFPLAVQAQEVTFQGQVEDVSGTTGLFFVDCTDVSLTSSVFNLNDFVGLSTEITGMWNGSVVAPAVDVTGLIVVTEAFEVGGSAKIGAEVRFGVTGPTGQIAIAAGSPASSFLPIPGRGAVMIDPTSFFIVGSGAIHLDGQIEFVVPIPNDPALIGVDVFGQGGILDPVTGFWLTNSDCKTISS